MDLSQLTSEQIQAIMALKGQAPVPAAPPPFTGYQPNFTMQGGNLPVPYQTPGLPAQVPMAPAQATPIPPAPAAAPEAAAALGGGAEAGPAIAAAAPGLLSRLWGGAKAVGRFGGLPLGLASAASALDPEHLDNQGGKDTLADALNPSGGDTGFSSIIKNLGRGAAYAGENLDLDEGTPVGDFFFKTKDEKAAEAKNVSTAAAGQPLSPNQPTIDQALGLAPSGGSGGKGNQTMLAPSRGRNPVLDALEGNMIANQPAEFKGLPAGMEQTLAREGIFQAASETPGLRPGLALAGRMGASAERAKLQVGQANAALALKTSEARSKWAVDAAKTGGELEKQNEAEQEKSLEVHMGRGQHPTLVVSTQIGDDGKPYKVIKPLNDEYFGISRNAGTGQIDPHASVTVMGAKFSHLDKDPFAKPAMLLGNIQKDGQLATVMNMSDVAPLMKEVDEQTMKSLPAGSAPSALAKAQMDNRRGALFQLMAQKPEFEQRLINMQYNLHTRGAPGGGASVLDEGHPAAALNPEQGEAEAPSDDYLSQLQAAGADKE